MHENIKRVLIWTGWLRLSHWLLASAIVFQIISAMVLRQQTSEYQFWLDWHLMTGQLLIIILLLRLILLFIPGTSSWRALIPIHTDFSAIRQMFRFYLSFGRFPLPNWYAHNPAWKPIYLLFFTLLAICLLTGILHDNPYLLAGFSMASIHAATAGAITAFVVFHVLAVFMHDLKGKGGLISAMVNGYRYFHIEPLESSQTADAESSVATYIPLDQLKPPNAASDHHDSESSP